MTLNRKIGLHDIFYKIDMSYLKKNCTKVAYSLTHSLEIIINTVDCFIV